MKKVLGYQYVSKEGDLSFVRRIIEDGLRNYKVVNVIVEVEEPEKCKACKEADRLFGDKQCNEAMHREYAREADHLRKYHCACEVIR